MGFIRILIYLVALALILIGIISMASATNYTINVYDGVGAGDEDTPNYIPDEEEEEEEVEPVHYDRSVDNSLQASERLSEDNDQIVKSSVPIGLEEEILTPNTAIIPINYTPYILWGIIIIFIIALIWGAWYIYSIYYY